MICMMYRMNNKVTKKALVCSAHHRKYKGKNATRKMAWNSIDIHPCCDLDFIVYAEPDIRSKSIRSALIILFGVVVVEFDWFDDDHCDGVAFCECNDDLLLLTPTVIWSSVVIAIVIAADVRSHCCLS